MSRANPHAYETIDETVVHLRQESRRRKAAPPRFNFVRLSDVKAKPAAPYLVHEIVPREGVAVLWSPPKVGKTFAMIDMAIHIATGKTYYGHTAQQGAVVYLAAEGEQGFARRLEAYKQRHPDTVDAPFYLAATSLNLVDEYEEFARAIHEQVENPVLIVLDTLARTFRGSESADRDMQEYIRALARLADTFKCCVLVIHHSGHDGNRARGHSSLAGAADVMLSLDSLGERQVCLTVDNMKDGPYGQSIRLEQETIELGVDENGEVINSCVMRAARSMFDRPLKELGKNDSAPQKIAFDALTKCLGLEGELAPDSLGLLPDAKVSKIDLWRTRSIEAHISKGEERARQKAFRNAMDALVRAGKVCVNKDYAWLPIRVVMPPKSSN